MMMMTTTIRSGTYLVEISLHDMPGAINFKSSNCSVSTNFQCIEYVAFYSEPVDKGVCATSRKKSFFFNDL